MAQTLQNKILQSYFSGNIIVRKLSCPFRRPYLHQVVLGHRVRYPAHFVVGLENVIVNLEFLPAIVPVGKKKKKRKKTRQQFRQGNPGSIQLPTTVCTAWIDKWVDNGGKHRGEGTGKGGAEGPGVWYTSPQ